MNDIRCTKCGDTKPPESFKPHKRKSNGRDSWCRVCNAEAGKLWRSLNADKFKATSKRWRERCGSAYHKQWRKENAALYSGYHKKWRLANPEQVRGYGRTADKKRKADPTFRIARAVSTAIRKSLQRGKNGYSWESLVGYSAAQLVRHLEERFAPGMSWSNREQWHIDHITPISVFEYASPDDPAFLQCWALDNLRPMWAAENMSKKNKLTVVDIHV